MSKSNDWTVRKAVRLMVPGERFIFADDIGGDGQVLTVVAISADMFGITEVEAEELDCTLDLPSTGWVTMATSEEPDGWAEAGMRAVWTDPDGGQRKAGVIQSVRDGGDELYMAFDDGGYADVFIDELEKEGA